MKHLTRTLVCSVALVASSTAFAERGSDGQLNIIYWQAPSTMNPYLTGGTKDLEAASMVIEPLARYDETGTMVPTLAAEIPTVENGGVAQDLKSVTWKLKPGVKWSDGTPFTAADVVFTAEYCMHPESGCAQSNAFEGVVNVEAIDDLTVKYSFDAPKPFPYGPAAGLQTPMLQKAQFENCLGARAPECTKENFSPIGTGPFKVTEFKVNDVISYAANEHYREADKPAFATVVLKGGGDATGAAKAVLETGEFDYAWNLQVQPEILNDMAAKGKGEVLSAFGTQVERLFLNLTNSTPEAGEKRSVYDGGNNPHPFLTDKAVRQALSMAIDRQVLVDVGYGAAGTVTCNILPAPAIYTSTENDACKTQDIEGAKKLLDEAGWVPGSDGVREKDGVKLSVLFQTSTNAVRQDTQALVKDWWRQIGVDTELRNVDGSVFFGGDPGSPDTYQKFFADVQMFTASFDGIDPEVYMGRWTCDNIPGPDSQWQGKNYARYCNPEYDKLVKTLAATAKLEERAEIAKKLNNMIVQNFALVPLIYRGRVSAKSNTVDGVVMNAWDSELWNVANWSRKK